MRIVGGSWFIPCSGASDASTEPEDANAARGAGVAVDRADAERAPDDTATAIYPEVWFSSEAVDNGAT